MKYQADTNFMVLFTQSGTMVWVVGALGSKLGKSWHTLVFFPAKSSMFVESCHFEEENICGMIQGAGNKKWERRASVDGGPQTDFSNMGECKGDWRPSTCLLLETERSWKWPWSGHPQGGFLVFEFKFSVIQRACEPRNLAILLLFLLSYSANNLCCWRLTNTHKDRIILWYLEWEKD